MTTCGKQVKVYVGNKMYAYTKCGYVYVNCIGTVCVAQCDECKAKDKDK